MLNSLKTFLKNRIPYYRQLQALQKQYDEEMAEYRKLLDAAKQEAAERLQQLEAAKLEAAERLQLLQKAQGEIDNRDAQNRQQELNCKKMVEEYQKLLDATRQEAAERLQLLQKAQGEIDNRDEQNRRQELNCKKMAEEYQKLLDAARQEVRKRELEVRHVAAEYRKKLEAFRQEASAAAPQTPSATALKPTPQAVCVPASPEIPRCRICGSAMQFCFTRKLMEKYDVSYFHCDHCGHMQTEKPYWLQEAYQSALSDSDTGQIWRNERNRELVCAVLHRFFQPFPKVLEYAGGYGLLTRMLRDAGAECFWYDKYAVNTFARHFEDDGLRHYDLVLAFEALEHFEDPMYEFSEMFKRCDSLLFSEELLPHPCPEDWWYLCCEHGQHLHFYSRETLQYIADSFHKKFYFHGDVGLMTPQEIPQEDFEDLFVRQNEYAARFRASAHSLTRDDMNTVISEMLTP